MGLFYHNILVSKDLTMDEKQEVFENITGTTAGEMLRNARTTGRRKREIATIAKLLCIREEFLTALEEGNYTVLPEVVYILGFARNYAMELGVDPDMIVEKIKHELGIAETESFDVAPAVQNDVVKNISHQDGAKKWMKDIREFRAYKFVIKYWKWFVGGLILVVVLAGIAMVIMMPSGKDHTVAQATVQVVSNEPAYKQPVRERFGVENRDTAEIILQSVQESWVKVEDARGKTVFSRVLVPGDVYYVPAGGKNKATFGNAGGIDVWVRKELAPKVGEPNTRKNGIALNPDSLMGGKKSE